MTKMLARYWPLRVTILKTARFAIIRRIVAVSKPEAVAANTPPDRSGIPSALS